MLNIFWNYISNVGWVERSETHQILKTFEIGFITQSAGFNPSDFSTFTENVQFAFSGKPLKNKKAGPLTTLP